MTEFELKLEIPADRLPLVLAAMSAGKASKQRLQAYYYDTEEGVLAQHGITLRVRKEGLKWVQTAKGMVIDRAFSPLERLEHNVEIPPPLTGGIPLVILARHFGTPVGDSILQALKLSADEASPALVQLYKTDVQRLKKQVRLAGSVLEISLDQGQVIVDAKSLALCELEVELKQGRPEHAVQLASTWCANYGLWLSTITKSMKGQRLCIGRSFAPATSAIAPKFDCNANGQQIVIAILQSCLKQILANASEVAAGSDDPEHVHQLRVGIRRLRTGMRELKTLTDGIDPSWEEPLIVAFRDLGRYRDHDYVIHSLQPQIKAAGGPSLEMSFSDADISNLKIAVRSSAFQSVLFNLLAYIQAEEFDSVLGKKCVDHTVVKNKSANNTVVINNVVKNKVAKKILRARLKKLYSQIIKDGRKFLLLDETRQHAVRKRLKRLRYLTEFLAPLFSTRKTKSFVAALKPVQDALGFYNDEIMALQIYRKLASIDQRAWFGVGWLSARSKANAETCFYELNTFARARVFWE